MRFRRSAIIAALATTAALSCTPERALAPFQFLAPGTANNINGDSVVISQVYGGGGNTGATFKNDFIELYNPGLAPQSLVGWSVQYASAAGTTWQVTTLSGTIQPGAYYLVQEAAGAGGTVNLPTPDAIGSGTGIAMSATAGKVALVRSTTALTGACPTSGAGFVDFVGYGTTATCFEGPGPAPAPSNTTAALRGGAGCTDTDKNSADFTAGAPTPRNSGSATHVCGTVTLAGAGAANPSSALPGATTLLTVTLTSFVTGATTAVSADLSSIGGTTTTSLVDDGSNGDVTAGDHIFSRSVTVASSVSPGAKVLPVALSDNQGHTGTSSIALTVLAPAVTPPLVITELMANPAAVDDNAPGGEWFEVFNSTHSPINLNGWTIVSGVSAGGTESHTIVGDVIVPAGGFAVLGNNSNAATNGGVTEQYQYAGIFLGNNTTDWIKLVKTDLSMADSVSYSARNASGVVTAPTYSPNPGISRAVIDISQDNSSMAGPNWADTPAGITYGAGDRGTPGTGPYFATGTGAPVLVVVTPNPAQVTPGGTRLFTATAKDADGLNTPSTFTWNSSNTSLATVGTSGLVTGVALGTGIAITATSANGVSGSATLDVVPPAVASISLNMNTPHEIPAGFVKPAFITLIADANGNAISPTPTLTWSSADETIATVDATGYVTGVAPGTVEIRATANNGVVGTLSVLVDPETAPTSADYHNNTEFGIPSDGSPSDDILITRPQYTLSYNAARGGPNWVSWDVNASVFGPAPRCDCFSPDPLLPSGPTGVYHVVDADYRNGLGGQIDRGHMTQSEERTADLQENAATFYLTNVLPQASENNQGPWSKLENDLNDSARTGGREVHVIAGGIFSAHPKTLKGEGKVAIPDWTWKIAVIQPAGATLADVHAVGDIDVIAVIMPNDTTVGTPNSARGIRNLPWATFTTTVDAIEAATGYDFLAALPDQIEIQVESGDHAPVASIAGSTGGFEGEVLTFDGSGSTDADHDALAYNWGFGDGVAANGATVSHTYADNGTYTVTLTVTDPLGVYDVQSRTVTITNVAPTASFSAPASVNEGSAFTLSLGGASDPSSVDQASLRYAFDCGDGAGYGPLGAATSATCPTTVRGSRATRSRVEDKDGGFTEYAAAVTVDNVVPMVAPFAGANLITSETYAAAGSFSDPGAEPWSATVNYGDGSGSLPLALSGQTFSLSHTYLTAGTFTVTVAVNDGLATGTGTSTVTVLTPAQAVQGIIALVPDVGSLQAKLKAAIQSLNRGNNGAAVNQLGAFLNEVDALVQSGRMSAAQADALRAAVNRAIASVSSAAA